MSRAIAQTLELLLFAQRVHVLFSGVSMTWLNSFYVFFLKCKMKYRTHLSYSVFIIRECKILLGKSEGTRSRGRPKIRWEGNIIRDLKKVDYEGDW